MEAGLGDARRDRRCANIRRTLRKNPGRSFPAAFGSRRLKALYRFLNNKHCDWQTLLQPELEQTVQRIVDARVCFAIDDSTNFMFGGEALRSDVGSLDGHGASFQGHFALAVGTAELAKPLGILGIEAVFRPDGPRRRKDWQATYDSPDKESLRWPRMVERVEALVDGRASMIHLMDSEGDDFALLWSMVEQGRRFVIRAKTDRVLAAGKGHLSQSLADIEAVVCRQVRLSRRTKTACRGRNTKHKPRQERLAKLHIRARRVEVRRPQHVGESASKSLALHVVHVFETDVPEGAEPVDWKLYTTEPIDTPEQIVAIVDYYRRRWIIEEYFKALKTGCSYEKRQLENRTALLNALALLAPIARELLALRSESRDDTALPSLTPTQIRVLRAFSPRPLPERPTARDCMLAVAALGGHIKNNGEPGWLVLGRGYLDLLAYQAGWVAHERTGQS